MMAGDVTRPVYLQGSSVLVGWADARKSLTDLIFDVVSAALAEAGAAMAEADSIVIAAHDLIDGRSLSSMVTAPAAGAYLRDEIRLAEDGLAAVSLGAARVASGESEMTVVAAWGRASEGDPASTARAAMDPFMVQPLGLGDPDISAFRLSRWLMAHRDTPAIREAAGHRRHGQAAANPRGGTVFGPSAALPGPLRAGEGPAWADVVAAAVLTTRPAAVRIAGVGHGTDPSAPGERDLLAMPALLAAATQAASQAGRPLDALDLFELDGPTLSDEVLALEALGLCKPGEGFAAYAGSATVNRSGGGAAGWCYPAMGLVRLVECHRQLAGRAGAVQQTPRPRTALATGWGPVGGQTQIAVVLEMVP